MFKKLDIYIIKKFLGTFFFSLILIIPVVVVFDLSEKMRDFIERKAPVKGIIVDYYFNFIPYLVNQFSPLFVFIAVIFFTSKMASNSEIVAILSSGVSFKRLLRPYLMSAVVLAILSFYLNNFLIPDANKERLVFEEIYYRNKLRNDSHHIHLQITPNTYIYMTNYNVDLNMGINFSIETFENGELKYKLLSDNVRWDSIKNTWEISNYVERHLNGLNETIATGYRKDTILNFTPEEFKRRDNFIETKNYFELNELIKEEKFKGSSYAIDCEIKKQERAAYPFATFVLTIIGVSLSSRKVRGGIGLHIGLGLLISFSYILFMQISSTFAKNSGIPAIIAVWMPNILYSILALYLLKKAPK